jgi:hypothetical protein
MSTVWWTALSKAFRRIKKLFVPGSTKEILF